MGFIYKITNNLNQHCYIGQTSRDYQIRWEEHKRDAFDNSFMGYNFILYKAFRKYGIENFSFSIIEECQNSDLKEREQYWISFYNSYSGDKLGGYNMTRGGEGNLLINYNTVYKLWDENYTVGQIAKILGHDRSAIREILKGYKNYSTEESILRGKILQHGDEEQGKKPQNGTKKYIVVLQYSIKGEFLAEYFDRKEASKKTGIDEKAIWQALRGSSKTAGGFQWIYKGDPKPKDISQERLNIYYKTKVCQYSKDGVYINEYESAAEAGRQLNINSGLIRKNCQGKAKTAGGYVWKYKDGD